MVVSEDAGKSVFSIGYVVYSKDLGIILVCWLKKQKMWVRNVGLIVSWLAG